VAYNYQKHTYYTRVASALFEYGEISNDEVAKKSALKMVEWTLFNQLANGFFKKSSFLETHPPFLHTMIYVLEGLLEIYLRNGDKRLLSAILKNANRLKDINLSRDYILCSEYDEDFNCLNSEKCVTGLAQWAGVALKLYKIVGDEEFKIVAIKTLFYLKAKQLKSCEKLKGAHPASIPFWGRYGSLIL